MPIVDSFGADHAPVRVLRALSPWSRGPSLVLPGAPCIVTGLFKSQIDWWPQERGSVRPTQGRTLVVMQVSGGSQSFNADNGARWSANA